MTLYEKATALVGNMPHIYLGVTNSELALITVDRSQTVLEGECLIATNEPVEALAAKELIVPDSNV